LASPPGQVDEDFVDALFDPTTTDDCTQTKLGACFGAPETGIVCLASGVSRKACEQRFNGVFAEGSSCTPP